MDLSARRVRSVTLSGWLRTARLTLVWMGMQRCVCMAAAAGHDGWGGRLLLMSLCHVVAWLLRPAQASHRR